MTGRSLVEAATTTASLMYSLWIFASIGLVFDRMGLVDLSDGAVTVVRFVHYEMLPFVPGILVAEYLGKAYLHGGPTIGALMPFGIGMLVWLVVRHSDDDDRWKRRRRRLSSRLRNGFTRPALAASGGVR